MTEKLEQLYCIKFCQKLGDTQVETILKIQQAFGDSAPSITQIKEWYNRFKDGGTLAESESHSGRSSISQNDACIDQMQTLVDGQGTVRNMETDRLIPSENTEPNYEGKTVKKEANGEEESHVSHVIKRTKTTHFPSLFCPDEDSFLYCEKCSLKYEGGCPDHGPLIYIDNAEVGQDEGCSQDLSLHVQAAKDRKVGGKEKVLQPQVSEARSDDVRTLQNVDCSTESDQMYSVSEINIELCEPGTSCGLQSDVEIKTDPQTHRHKIIHTREKPCMYDVCGAGLAVYGDLNVHKGELTGEKPYKCDFCGVGFAGLGSLKSHKRTHTGEKPYKCDVCGVGFTQHANLSRHKRTHTGEKPYKCDLCGVGFTQHANLSRHKRTHTGEKPYKCDMCGVEFAQNGELITHRRTHTGERPYKCDVCGVGFTLHGNLNRHMRTHTGEKPYKCDVCGVGYADQGCLKRHKRIHTGEKIYKCDVQV